MYILNALKKLDKKEIRLLIIISVFLIILTAVPYLYGYFNAPPNWQYTGQHSLAVGDLAVYYSYINQIKAGNYLLFDYFTSEIQPVGTFNIFWFSIGWFARIFNLTPLLSFNLSRLLLIPVLIFLLYAFIGYFIEEYKYKKITLLLLIFASGMGALASIFIISQPIVQNTFTLYQWPIDLWVAESNIFLSLYHNPLFVASIIMMILLWQFLLLAFEKDKYNYSILAGLVGLIWFNFHAYYFFYVFFIGSAYVLYEILIRKKYSSLAHWLIILAISMLSVAYYLYLNLIDPVIAGKTMQNICLTPGFFFVVIGFGLPLFAGIYGLIYLWDTKKQQLGNKTIFLAIWLFVGSILIYVPFGFQRRFLEGLQIPMIILAVMGGQELFNFSKKYVIAALIIFLLCFSTFFNLVRDGYYFHKQLSILYIPNEFANLVKMINDANIDKKAILADETNSLYIPFFVNQPVYIGHGHETINYDYKNALANAFWQNQLDADQELAFLRQNNIGYILLTKGKTSWQYQTEDKNFLEPVSQSEYFKLYLVK